MDNILNFVTNYHTEFGFFLFLILVIIYIINNWKVSVDSDLFVKLFILLAVSIFLPYTIRIMITSVFFREKMEGCSDYIQLIVIASIFLILIEIIGIKSILFSKRNSFLSFR